MAPKVYLLKSVNHPATGADFSLRAITSLLQVVFLISQKCEISSHWTGPFEGAESELFVHYHLLSCAVPRLYDH